jgi:hypothetical protein
MSFELKEVMPQVGAYAEVVALMDAKRILPSRRRDLEKAVDALTDAIQYGIVTVDSDRNISIQLQEPLKDKGGNVALSSITWKHRADMAAINQRLSALKADNGSGRMMVYVQAHTGLDAGLVDKLETCDRAILDAVTLFFL